MAASVVALALAASAAVVAASVRCSATEVRPAALALVLAFSCQFLLDNFHYVSGGTFTQINIYRDRTGRFFHPR